MLIKNGKVYRDHKFEYEDIRVEEGRIIEFLPTCSNGRPGEEVLDVFGAYVVPGFIDLQVHGAAGCDFSDADEGAQDDISRFLLMHGVTGYLAAADSFPDEILEEAYASVKDRVGKDLGGAILYGIHMTGPFISPEHSGMQDRRYVKKPDSSLVAHLNELSGGAVKMVDLSPELPGARDFVRQVSGQCLVSLSHSGADFDTARMCYSYGAQLVGDLYMNMPDISPADPGLLGAAVDASRFALFTINGANIHPAAIRMAYQLFSGKRICLTANTAAYCGLAPDTYVIDGHQIKVDARSACFEDGSFAGGVMCLDDIIHLNTDMGGIPLALSIDSATETPARALGIFDEVGSIDIGKRADLVIMDLHSLQVKNVILRGRVMMTPHEGR